eukprot:6678649-Lingulodinium_polyedra.AAC.1
MPGQLHVIPNAAAETRSERPLRRGRSNAGSAGSTHQALRASARLAANAAQRQRRKDRPLQPTTSRACSRRSGAGGRVRPQPLE